LSLLWVSHRVASTGLIDQDGDLKQRLAAVRRSWVGAAVVIVCGLVASGLGAQDFSGTQTRPAPETALIEKANDALGAGDFAGALKMLTALNAQTPNNPQVLFDLGLAMEATEDGAPAGSGAGEKAPTAESYYRKAIDANPLFPAPHVALGLLLARTGRPTEAHAELATATGLADAEPVLKARAFRALARLELNGDAQHSVGPNPAAASGDLISALNLTPEAPEDVLLSAEIAEAVPDLAAAEKAYRRYLALPGNAASPDATSALAHVLLAEHHPADAEALLGPALEAHPGDPTLTSQLAAAYLASGDSVRIAKAAPLLETLHAAQPQDANITRLLARVYLETGHLEQADTLYAGLILAASQTGTSVDPTLLADRGEVLIRLHRPGEAETLLKRAVATPGAFPSPAALGDAAMQLAFAASEIDDPKVALQALAIRSTVLPPSPSSLFLEATENDTVHQSTKAATLYRQFLTAANGNFPEQESRARQRLAVLDSRK
jgi:Tfp pilus assembly protein PilF